MGLNSVTLTGEKVMSELNLLDELNKIKDVEKILSVSEYFHRFLNDYKIMIDDDSYDSIVTELKDLDREGKLSYFCDSMYPAYFTNIDREYDRCNVSIDDVIEEGLIEAMYSESDVIYAKVTAIYMSISNKINEEINSVIEIVSDLAE